MSLSLRRLGVALGALAEAALVLWLLSGFLPAGLALVGLALLLGFAIYRDIIGRQRPPAGGIR